MAYDRLMTFNAPFKTDRTGDKPVQVPIPLFYQGIEYTEFQTWGYEQEPPILDLADQIVSVYGDYARGQQIGKSLYIVPYTPILTRAYATMRDGTPLEGTLANTTWYSFTVDDRYYTIGEITVMQGRRQLKVSGFEGQPELPRVN